jgi:hypothetical protein
VHSQENPEIISWIVNTEAETGYNGITSNVQSVDYTANDVYVSCTCIPGYDIGPWAGNPNTPSNQNFVFKITRNPQQNNGNLIATPLGHIGVWTNGVSIFNAKDAFSYNNQNVWFQNAIVVEGPSFDLCGGHPAPNGEYHHHLNPSCIYDVSDDDMHSPIIGYAFDGFPIYGAHAYLNTDGTGGIARMKSSYRLRDITSRTTLPDGSLAANAGPLVSEDYPLGYYIEDYEFMEGLGDLDEFNGRFCVTPEYPDGTYAYFCTVDENFEAEYPYVIGPNYYGTIQNGNTGPQSGHNIIPGDAENWSPNSVSELSTVNLTVYPNPCGDRLNLSSSLLSGFILKLCIYSVDGKLIQEEIVHGNFYSYEINTSTLEAGSYILQVMTINGLFAHTILKQ